MSIDGPRFVVTRHTRPVWETIRSLHAAGDHQVLRDSGVHGAIANCYELGAKGRKPVWVDPMSAGAAAWLAGLADASKCTWCGRAGGETPTPCWNRRGEFFCSPAHRRALGRLTS